MRIEINPRSLLNLEHICEVLYKLHPSVLDYLFKMERYLGDVLGVIDLNNLSLKEREFLSSIYEEEDFSCESITQDDEEFEVINETFADKEDYIKFLDENKSNNSDIEDNTSRLLKIIENLVKDKNSIKFDNLRKYIQLETDEYIPMKIYVEVEDPVIGRKVKKLVETLKKLELQNSFI